jgi:hypothetical protein
MAHDLVPKMSPYLDRHLVFPLLEFLQEKEVGGTFSSYRFFQLTDVLQEIHLIPTCGSPLAKGVPAIS